MPDEDMDSLVPTSLISLYSLSPSTVIRVFTVYMNKAMVPVLCLPYKTDQDISAVHLEHLGDVFICCHMPWLRLIIKILNFRTDIFGAKPCRLIRRLLEEQSDQGLHCLLFHFHHLEVLHIGRTSKV